MFNSVDFVILICIVRLGSIYGGGFGVLVVAFDCFLFVMCVVVWLLLTFASLGGLGLV